MDHTILVGAGRVGGRIAKALHDTGVLLFVMDADERLVAKLKKIGIEAVAGNAVTELRAANPARARALIVAIPESFEAGQITEQARAIHPDLKIIARAHSDAESEHLRACGADTVVLGEEEIAIALINQFRAVGGGRPA